MAQCFFSLGLYEDSLKFANKALYLDKGHIKSLNLKGKCLALLFKFDESIEILK